MNWEALGAISSAVGALAVMVSLVYLALQIRQNTRATRAAIAHEAVLAARDFNRSFMENHELAEVYVKGWEEQIDPSDDRQRAQFLHVAFNMFKLAEDLHYQYSNGTLEKDVWEGWEKLFATYLLSPGGRTYWKQRRQVFSSKFRDYLESLPPVDTPRHAVILSVEKEIAIESENENSA